jgi:hypothetical protein
MKGKIRRILRESLGDLVKSRLGSQYEQLVTENLLSDKKQEWATYNQVVIELKNLKERKKIEEVQYRLTDKEDPNQVMMEVLETFGGLTPELERLYNKIKNF